MSVQHSLAYPGGSLQGFSVICSAECQGFWGLSLGDYSSANDLWPPSHDASPGELKDSLQVPLLENSPQVSFGLAERWD